MISWRSIAPTLVSLLLVAAVTPSCTGDTRVPTPIARASFLDELATALCEVAEPCCAPEGFKPNATCATDLKAIYQGKSARVTLDDPSVAYDASAAGSCISAIQGLRGLCYVRASEASAVAQACTKVFTTLADPGDACTPIGGPFVLSQCVASDTECDVATRTCVKLPTVGEPCTHHCADGAYCDTSVCKSVGIAREPCSTPLSCASFTCSSFACAGPDAEAGTRISSTLPTACTL
jgi:hypothetical protein